MCVCVCGVYVRVYMYGEREGRKGEKGEDKETRRFDRSGRIAAF